MAQLDQKCSNVTTAGLSCRAQNLIAPVAWQTDGMDCSQNVNYELIKYVQNLSQ